MTESQRTAILSTVEQRLRFLHPGETVVLRVTDPGNVHEISGAHGNYTHLTHTAHWSIDVLRPNGQNDTLHYSEPKSPVSR